ncbi:MAG: oligosaccharide flippase family protein [Thermodesulfobacteriota bacterium]
MTLAYQKIFTGSFFRIISLLANIVVALFMMPFVVGNLGDEVYGLWVLVGTFLGYYGLFDLGLTTAVNRHIAHALGERDEKQANVVFNTAVILFSIVGLLVCLVAVIVALLGGMIWDLGATPNTFRAVMVVLGLSLGLSFPMRAYRGVLVANSRFDLTSILQILSLCLRTLLVVVVLKLGYGIVSMAVATLVSGIPEYIFLIFWAKRELGSLRLRFSDFRKDMMKSLSSYSFFTFIAQVSDQLRFNVDALVITSLVGLPLVTHYKIASELMRYSISLVVAAVGVFQPVFSRIYAEKKDDEIVELFFFATKNSTYITFFVFFGFLFWGRDFITWWMGKEYLDAFPCLVVLSIGGVFALSQVPSVNLLYGIAKHHFFAWCNFLEGMANLILSILLAPEYGILGVALGTCIPMVIVKVFIQPVFVCKAVSIPLKTYFRRLLMAFFCSFVALLVPGCLTALFVSPDILTLFCLGAGSLVIYVYLLSLFGFTKDEKLKFAWLGEKFSIGGR